MEAVAQLILNVEFSDLKEFKFFLNSLLYNTLNLALKRLFRTIDSWGRKTLEFIYSYL